MKLEREVLKKAQEPLNKLKEEVENLRKALDKTKKISDESLPEKSPDLKETKTKKPLTIYEYEAMKNDFESKLRKLYLKLDKEGRADWASKKPGQIDRRNDRLLQYRQMVDYYNEKLTVARLGLDVDIDPPPLLKPITATKKPGFGKK